MRLAVVNLTGGGLSLGYRKYLAEMLPRLAKHPDVEDLVVFAPARALTQASIGGVGVVPWSTRDSWLGLRSVRREIHARRAGVVFVPTARPFRASAVPTVVMVRNMEPFEVPFGSNPLPEALRNHLRLREARRACRTAERVLAVSEHVRTHLVRRWQLNPDSVGVVRHGVGEPELASGFTPPAWPGAVAPDLFLFTAGSLRPARGLEDLIRAMSSLRSLFPDLTAVIAGGQDRFMSAYVEGLRRLAAELGVADRIVWPGRLDAQQMAWCFGHAALFVMTSRAEACPNIALEAMSHGSFCVSVDRPPMPEFFADTALYYREGDAEQLAERVRGLLHRPGESADRRAAARRRARSFTWERTVDETVIQLEKAMGNCGRAGSRDGMTAGDER